MDEPTNCPGFVRHIVEYFYGHIDRERFTEDAQNHIERLTIYSICFAFETGGKSSPLWWSSKRGKTYWEFHARNVAKRLPDDPDRLINGITLQKVIIDYAPRFTRRLVARLMALDVGELVQRLGGENPEPSRFPPHIEEILEVCPFKL
jgi:hypothetical protein